tara:strand:+ start:7797 stop:9089 length:1293 start_codon:yes stop_codon:yes gene_type:complete
MAYAERLNNFNETVNRANETASQASEYAQGLKEKLNDPSASLFSKVNSVVNTTAGTTSTMAGLYTSYKHAKLTNWSTQKDLLDVKQGLLDQAKAKLPGSNPASAVSAPARQVPELDNSAFSSQAGRVKSLSNAGDIKSQIAGDPIAGKNPNMDGLSASDKQDIFDARNNIIDQNVKQLPSPAGQGAQGAAGGQAPAPAQAPQGAASNPGQANAPAQAQNVSTDVDAAANDAKNAIGAAQTPVQQSAALGNDANDLASALRSGGGSAVTGLKSVAGVGQDAQALTGAANDAKAITSVGDMASQFLPGNAPGIINGAKSLANGAQAAVQGAGNAVNGISSDIQTGLSTAAKVGASVGEDVGSDALSGVATGLLASAPELGPAGLITGAVGGLISLGSTIAGLFESKPKSPPPPAAAPVIQASVGANLSQIQK